MSAPIDDIDDLKLIANALNAAWRRLAVNGINASGMEPADIVALAKELEDLDEDEDELDNEVTLITVELEIRGKKGDAFYVVDSLLDAGFFQDAINAHDCDAGKVHVEAATCLLGAEPEPLPGEPHLRFPIPKNI